MLDEDERHPGVGRQALEQLAERLQAPRRCADADDGEGRRGGGFHTAPVPGLRRRSLGCCPR